MELHPSYMSALPTHRNSSVQGILESRTHMRTGKYKSPQSPHGHDSNGLRASKIGTPSRSWSISGISVELVSDVKWDDIKHKDKIGTAHRQGQKLPKRVPLY